MFSSLIRRAIALTASLTTLLLAAGCSCKKCDHGAAAGVRRDLSSPTGQWIIGLRDAREADVRFGEGAKVVHRRAGYVVVEGLTLGAVVAAQSDPRVRYVEPNHIFRALVVGGGAKIPLSKKAATPPGKEVATATPDDEYFGRLQGMRDVNA